MFEVIIPCCVSQKSQNIPVSEKQNIVSLFFKCKVLSKCLIASLGTISAPPLHTKDKVVIVHSLLLLFITAQQLPAEWTCRECEAFLTLVNRGISIVIFRASVKFEIYKWEPNKLQMNWHLYGTNVAMQFVLLTLFYSSSASWFCKRMVWC